MPATSDAPSSIGAVHGFSGFATDDIAATKAFYADVLDLEVMEQDGLLHLTLPAGPQVLVYPKPNHVPATFTVLNLVVEDIEASVDELTQRGVVFDRSGGIPVDDRGIMREGGPLIAWFADPAGNILSVLQP